MQIASKTIKSIENSPTLTERLLSALKTDGVEALAQYLHHPAASFVIAALHDWQKTNADLEV